MDVPRVEHPLADLEGELARNEGRRSLREPVVELGAILAGDLEDVAEALGDEEGAPDPAPFEEGIRRDGRAVHEEGDVLRPEAGLADDLADPLLHARGLVGRRRRRLGEVDAVGLGVEQNEIGERAAHVHAKSDIHRAVRMAGREASRGVARRREGARGGALAWAPGMGARRGHPA